MFGYIVINKSEMKFKEFDVYHSYYCGLCSTLQKVYGPPGQLSLSYDLTFVEMLLSSLYEPETEFTTARCIVHPFEKHGVRINEISSYVADMNVLLTILKCQDDWVDEKKLHRKVFASLLSGKNKKQRKQYREKVLRIRELMSEMSRLEEENCPDIDRMGGLFGQVMGQVLIYREDEWKENLERLGFFLGKFIYLLDAYEDIEGDIKNNRYNPLRQWYASVDFEERCHTVLTLLMSDCCKEFELLPLLDNVEILRNILYSGVWTRYEMVHAGRVKENS